MAYQMRIRPLDKIPVVNPVVVLADGTKRALGNLAMGNPVNVRVEVSFLDRDRVGSSVRLVFKLNGGDRIAYRYRIDAAWDGVAVAERIRVELLDGGDTVAESFYG